MLKFNPPIKMEYENMRVPELKSLARDRGLRNYSRIRKAELVLRYIKAWVSNAHENELEKYKYLP